MLFRRWTVANKRCSSLPSRDLCASVFLWSAIQRNITTQTDTGIQYSFCHHLCYKLCQVEVTWSFCQLCQVEVTWSFCHSVNRITDKRGNRRRPNLVTVQKWLTFGGDRDPHVDSGSLSHYLHRCIIEDFFGHLLVFFIQSTANLYHTWWNDWRRQGNASTTFWDRTDRTDIWIWICINPAIRNGIQGDFW